MRDVSQGAVRLQPLDNDRYPEVGRTGLREHLSTTMAVSTPRERRAS